MRIQETQQELPRGSIPRSLEVILRAETVEMVQAGDKCDFIGTLIAIPDVAQLAMDGGSVYLSVWVVVAIVLVLILEGARSEASTRVRKGEGYDAEGVR